jgi:membrane peptidoglycan carboxypeptidase
MMGNTNGYNCYTSNTDLSPGADQDQLKAGETQCYGSAAIGDGAYLHLDDHVNGIATLARLGNEIPRTFILKIVDSSNKTLYQFQQPTGKQVIRQDSAYIVDNMASDPNASYLPGSCTTTGSTPTCRQFSQGAGNFKFQRYNGWTFAVKTGTTNSGFDGLMASWSTQYTAVTWVGYHTRNKTMVGPGMEYMTEPIVRAWMQGAHDQLNMKPVNWQQPSDIKTLPAFVVRNHVGIGSIEPSPSNDIFPSWYVQPKGGNSGNATIDMVSNKVATSCTPDIAKKNEGGANVNAFSADIFYGTTASTSNTTATDDVHNCNDTKPSVSITQNSCEEANKCDFTVAVTQGTHPLSGGSYTSSPAGSITLFVNSQGVQTIAIPSSNGDSFNYTFTGVSVTDGQLVQAQAVDSVLYTGSSEQITAQHTGTAAPHTP